MLGPDLIEDDWCVLVLDAVERQWDARVVPNEGGQTLGCEMSDFGYRRAGGRRAADRAVANRCDESFRGPGLPKGTYPR